MSSLIKYISQLANSLSGWVCWSGLVVFCIGSVFLFKKKGLRFGFKYSMGLLLLEYVIILLCSTVIFRPTLSVKEYNFIPLNSYIEYQQGREIMLPESLMNVLVFIPIGVLLELFFNKWYNIAIIGACISFVIESLQFGFQRGYCEIDDVIHNTLGCILGLLIARHFSKCTRVSKYDL